MLCYVFNFPAGPDTLAEAAKFTSEFTEGGFTDVASSNRPPAVSVRGPSEEGQDVDNELEEEGEDQQEERDIVAPRLFSCPNEGCICTYQRFSSVERHLEHGRCVLKQERETLYDKAKLLYREKLLEGQTSQPQLQTATLQDVRPELEVLPKGWALKEGRKAQRFSEAQKAYLDEMFDRGKASGHKLDHVTVSRDMRFAKDFKGERKFGISDFLSASQIQSYFSRKSAKDRHAPAEERRQADYEEMRAAVLTECQLRHPIVFESIDLCKLRSDNELNKLSVSFLVRVCQFLDIDTSDVRQKRKLPYTTRINDMLQSCTCVSVA